ncbi:MAG: hypothetical protein U9Q33_04725 [Campylobacterota bacterium]|nr:hypothetical protein [Campylobacterota bacterium]
MKNQNKHIIPKSQLEVIKKLKDSKEKKEDYAHLQISHKLLEFIFKLDINSTSKLILINLIKRQSWTLNHLYIAVSYKQLENDINMKHGSIYNSIKQLKDNDLIEVISGTQDKEKIRNIKEIIYNQTQRATRSFNELNIYSLEPLYKKFLTMPNNK